MRACHLQTLNAGQKPGLPYLIYPADHPPPFHLDHSPRVNLPSRWPATEKRDSTTLVHLLTGAHPAQTQRGPPDWIREASPATASLPHCLTALALSS